VAEGLLDIDEEQGGLHGLALAWSEACMVRRRPALVAAACGLQADRSGHAALASRVWQGQVDLVNLLKLRDLLGRGFARGRHRVCRRFGWCAQPGPRRPLERTNRMNDAPASQDVVQLLTRQHRQVESRMQALVDAEDAGRRKQLLAEATDELTVHISAEEHVFYPEVRAARTEDILLESLEEHLSLKRLVADLLLLDPEETTFTPKCKVLAEQAEHHHKEEEEHLFPKVLQLLDAKQRTQLGGQVLAHEDMLRKKGQPRQAVQSETDAALPLK